MIALRESDDASLVREPRVSCAKDMDFFWRSLFDHIATRICRE
jgi:hypothetical protein